MKSDAIPGDQCEQTVQSCRNSISTWLDSPRVPLYWTPPTPPIPLSLGLPSCPSRTPVNKATQEQRSPSVPLKSGGLHGACARVRVNGVWRGVHLCLHAWALCLRGCGVSGSAHSHSHVEPVSGVNPDTEADERTPWSLLYRTRTFVSLQKNISRHSGLNRRQWRCFFYDLAYLESPRLIHHSQHSKSDTSASLPRKMAIKGCPGARDRTMGLSSQMPEANQATGQTTESRPNADNPWRVSMTLSSIHLC